MREVDYPTPEIVECPYPFYTSLRQESPVHRLPTGQYLVTRWEDAAHVATHPEVFSNFVGPVNRGLGGGDEVAGTAEGEARYTPWPLPFSDPPEHRVKRSLCQQMFARDKLAAYAPVIADLCHELIDGFADRGEVEFSGEFAGLLPLRVLSHIFGIGREHEQLLIASKGRQGLGVIFMPEDQKDAQTQNRTQMADFFRAQILARVAEPADDFLTEMIQTQVERDGELELPYLTVEATNLFGAGNVTTAHMIASAMWLLLENPSQMALVREDSGRIAPMLEESLRVESPVQWLQRVTTQDTELAGVEIPAGSIVLVVYAAANRDEGRFPDAEAFDVRRPNLVKDHLGFGRGIHRCVGAPLARLEGRIAFEILLDRLKDIRLADGNDLAHTDSSQQRGLRALHLEFARA